MTLEQETGTEILRPRFESLSSVLEFKVAHVAKSSLKIERHDCLKHKKWTKHIIVKDDNIAQWLAYLIPDPAAPGLNHRSRVFSIEKYDLAELIDSTLLKKMDSEKFN